MPWWIDRRVRRGLASATGSGIGCGERRCLYVEDKMMRCRTLDPAVEEQVSHMPRGSRLLERLSRWGAIAGEWEALDNPYYYADIPRWCSDKVSAESGLP